MVGGAGYAKGALSLSEGVPERTEKAAGRRSSQLEW